MNLAEEWTKYTSPKCIADLLPEKIIAQGTVVKYAANSVVLTTGDFPEYVYIVKSGQFQGLRQYQDGNSYYYFKLQPGETIGLIEVFAQEIESVSTIVALVDSTVWRIDSSTLYSYIMNDLKLLRHCLLLMSKYLYNKSNSHGQFYYKKGIDRVKSFILNYYEMNIGSSSSVIINTDYQNISNSIGVSLRTVGRSIQMLKQQGFVNSSNKKIIVTHDQYIMMLNEI